jgi:O-antigen/teichoic acid export membrane protein
MTLSAGVEAPADPYGAHPFRRRVVINTVATLAGNGWAILLTAASYPLVLAGLGTEAFGVWVLIQTFSAFTGWASLADLGVGTAAHRHLARRCATGDVAGAARVVSGVLAVATVGGVVAALALGGLGLLLLPVVVDLSPALTGTARVAMTLFSLQVAADAVTRGAQACLEGMHRVDVARALDAVRRTAVAGATAVAAQTAGSLDAVAGASLVASVVFAPVGLFLVRRRVPGVRLRPPLAETLELLAFGRSTLLLRSTGVLHRGMDRIVVGVLLGPAAVTVVDAATQVQMGAESVLGASSYSVTPAASWIDARRDPAGLRRLAVTGTRLSLLATLPFVVLPAVLAVPLVDVWLGEAGAGVAALVPLALAYSLVNAPVQVLSNLLVGIGRVGSVLWPALAAVGVNLIATMVLVGPLGPRGAFVGSLVGAAVLVPALLVAGCRAVEVPIPAFVRGAVRGPAVAALAAAAGAGAVVRGIAPGADLGDLATLVLGGLVGLAATALVAVRVLDTAARPHQEPLPVADWDG